MVGEVITAEKGWRERVTYSAHVMRAPSLTLDALNDLVTIPNTGDRYVDLADWLREGERLGLITPGEHRVLRVALGPHI